MVRQKPVGIGVIGCGGRIRGLLRQLLPVNKRLRLVALCDPLPASIEETRALFDFHGPVYADHREMLREAAIDWVMIGSWNCFHARQSAAAFKAGKNVFCEKPFATNIRDCNAMIRAWRDSGKMFSIGFTLRYSPHYVAIKKVLDKGAIGYPVSFEFNEVLSFSHGGHIMSDWRRRKEFTGTHLLEKCCHDIDLANWMTGSMARRVASFGGKNVFLPKNKHFLDRVGIHERSGRNYYMAWEQPHYTCPFTGDHDVVDNQVAIIEYANGVRAAFHTNMHSGIPERRLFIVGSERTLRADLVTGVIEVGRIGPERKIEPVAACARGGHGGGDEVLVKSLSGSMLRGTRPVTGFDDGLRSAVTTFGIDKAMDTGRVVDMAPLWKKVGIELPE